MKVLFKPVLSLLQPHSVASTNKTPYTPVVNTKVLDIAKSDVIRGKIEAPSMGPKFKSPKPDGGEPYIFPLYTHEDTFMRLGALDKKIKTYSQKRDWWQSKAQLQTVMKPLTALANRKTEKFKLEVGHYQAFRNAFVDHLRPVVEQFQKKKLLDDQLSLTPLGSQLFDHLAKDNRMARYTYF